MSKNKKNSSNLKTVEITPPSFRCALISCPSVFETDSGTYIIVGKKLDLKEVPQVVKSKIGDGEIAVEVPKGLLDELNS